MKKKGKRNILQEMLYVYEKAENCKLEKSFFTRMKSSLTNLAAYYGVTNTQALFISIIFIHQQVRGKTNLNFQKGFLQVTLTEILKYNDDFLDLTNKGILVREESYHGSEPNIVGDNFGIDDTVTYAVFRNLPMPEVQPKTLKTTAFMDIFDKLMEIIENFRYNHKNTDILGVDLDSLIDENLHYPIIHELREDKIDQVDSFTFLMVLREFICGEKKISHKKILKDSSFEFMASHSMLDFIQGFLNKEKELVKKGWLKVTTAENPTDIFFSAGKKTLDNLAAMGLDKYPLQDQTEDKEKNGKKKKKKKKESFANLIWPDEIPSRELFFNDSEGNDLNLIQSLITEPKFTELQDRLKTKNLPLGLNILLHGYPGTGKTESVLQMARITEREIIKVDISQVRSEYVGQSEKNIKAVFTAYQKVASKSKLTPILLFNEADALISKRKEKPKGRGGNYENTFQNVILEELENFKGILMATTNMVNNLDDAYDRRFLFKVEFFKPNVDTRTKIWQSKMPQLTLEQCYELSTDFDLTGGQINNITRKGETIFVIHGRDITYDEIREFCHKETWNTKNYSGIGFKSKTIKHTKAA